MGVIRELVRKELAAARAESFRMTPMGVKLLLCMLLSGCATVRVVPVDLRALDYNGCLLDVERRSAGSLHESATCDADRPDPASPP